VLRGQRDAAPPDFRGVVGGSPEGSLVQHTAWVGNPELVDWLLAHGADPAGAVGWAVRGSQYHAIPGRDYVGVVQRLLAAGEELEPNAVSEADGPLYEWLSGSDVVR
jgi:hypothetical protein